MESYQYVLFLVWLHSLSVIYLRFIHVVCIRGLFLFIAEWCSIEWIDYSLFSIHLWMDIWVFSRYGLILIKLWTFFYKSSLYMISLFLGNYLGVEIVGLFDRCVFTCRTNCQNVFPYWFFHFLLLQTTYENSSCSTSLTTFGHVRHFFLN